MLWGLLILLLRLLSAHYEYSTVQSASYGRANRASDPRCCNSRLVPPGVRDAPKVLVIQHVLAPFHVVVLSVALEAHVIELPRLRIGHPAATLPDTPGLENQGAYYAP